MPNSSPRIESEELSHKIDSRRTEVKLTDSDYHLSAKNNKKSKRHSKHDVYTTDMDLSDTSKSKKHKRSHEKVSSDSRRSKGQTYSDVLSKPPVEVAQICADNSIDTEQIQKKRKRSKDEAGSDSRQSLIEDVDIPTSVRKPKRSKKQVEDLEDRSRENVQVLIHESATGQRRSRSPDNFPEISSSPLSHASSRASRSFSGSPQQSRRQDQTHHEDERRERRSKHHSSDRRGSPDTHRRLSRRRVTVGYRRASHSRDSSLDDMSPVRHNYRQRRSRTPDSRSPSRTHPYESSSYSHHFNSRHHVQDTNRHSYHHKRDRSRSAARRYVRDEPVVEDRDYPIERSNRDGRSQAVVQADRHSRSKIDRQSSTKQPPSRRSRSKASEKIRMRRSREKDSPICSSSKHRQRQSKQSDDRTGHSRNAKRSSSISGNGSGPSGKPDVRRESQDMSEPTRKDDRLQRASGSPSAKRSSSERSRKSRANSKLNPVLELLNELKTESISDCELQTVLPVSVFMDPSHSACLLPIKSSFYNRSVSPESTQKDVQQPPDSVRIDENLSGPADHDRLAPFDSLDKLTTQIQQKLSGPETWDSRELSLCPSELDEDQDELVLGQSLVAMATSKVGMQPRPLRLLSSLSTPWQDLVASAGKLFESSQLRKQEAEFIKPFITPGVFYDGQYKLIPLQRKSSGAAVLRLIGVSKRYLGEDLLNCLNLDVDQTDESVSTSLNKQYGSTEIAWMQRRNRASGIVSSGLDNILEPIKTYRNSQLVDSVLDSGVLTAGSEFVIRQALLGMIS